MKKIAIVLVCAFATVGATCHGQVPPTSHTVTLTITPPANSSSYTYVISRAEVSGASCPAPNVQTPNYTPLNASNPISGTSYVDAGAAGTTVCYIAQSVVGGAVSVPSNTAGPFTVPANPTAPGIGGGTVASIQEQMDKEAVAYELSCHRDDDGTYWYRVSSGVYAPCNPHMKAKAPQLVASVK